MKLHVLFKRLFSRVLPQATQVRGNVMITMIGVMGAASIAGIVSYYDYFRVIAVQKAAMQYQTQINLALASSLDYIIWLVKQRACVNENLTRGLCSGTLDPINTNTERLLFLPTTAQAIADGMGGGKEAKDIMLDKMERTVALDAITDRHPLYQILQPLKGKGVVDYLYVKVIRDVSIGRKGREVYIRFIVGLRQKANTSLGSALESEALIAFFPRELANFSLVTSGNLVFAADRNEIPAENQTRSDSSFAAAAKSEATGAGLVFQSPVFVNKSIYLGTKAADGANSRDFVNITFGDSVSLGDGIIYQKNSNGNGYDNFKPLNAGGDDSTYNYQNVGVFGGFLRGLKLEMKDSGLDCLFNDPATCTVDTSLMSQCIGRSQMFADLSATKDSYIVLRPSASVQESGSGKELQQVFSYDLGLTSPDEFVPVDGLSVQRNPGLDTDCGGLGGAKSPCWNTVSTGSFVGDPGISGASVAVVSNDSSSATIQKPVLNVKATFAFFKNTVIVASDLGGADTFKFDLVFPSGAGGVTQAKTDLQNTIATQDTQILNNNTKIVCMNPSITPYPNPAPTPAPSPSVCAQSPLSCTGGTPFTQCGGKTDAEVTTDRDALVIARNTNQSSLNALTAAGDVDGKVVHFEISSAFDPKIPGVVRLTVLANGVGYLPSAPTIEFMAYDVGVSGLTGKDMRAPTVGPNQKDPRYNRIAYAMDTSGSNTKIREAPPNGTYSVGTWKLVNGENLGTGVPPNTTAQDLATLCKKNQAIAVGGGDWDANYEKSTTTSWHFAPKHAVLPRTIPNAKNILVINADNQGFFQVGSVLDKCVIDASVTTVMGFLVCDELYIDYTYSTAADGSVSVSSSSYQQRLKPLEIIGTFIVGRVKISPDTLKRSSITWRSIYHPASAATLRDSGSLWGTIKRPDACTISPNLPVWLPLPTPVRANELYRCSSASLRDKVNPIQWTSVTPDCGLKPGESTTTCSAPFRSKNFMTLDLFRRVGGAVAFDKIQSLTQAGTENAKAKKEAAGGGP